METAAHLTQTTLPAYATAFYLNRYQTPAYQKLLPIRAATSRQL